MSTTLALDFVRRQFPAFAEPSLQGKAFFENAGGTYACEQVIARLHDFYTKTKVQPHHRYPTAEQAGREMDASYPSFARYLNVHPDEIYFGPSTTQNTYVLAQAFRPLLEVGDEVVVTNQDHEANRGAWQRLAEFGVKVKEWRVDPETGSLDPDDLRALLSERTKIVAFSHCSNIVGEINPVSTIARLVHAVGATAVVDGVSYAGHGFPDVAGLGADIYLFSTYKTYGPHQGVMVVRSAAAAKLANQGHDFNAGVRSKRLTPAGPDHAQVAAARGVTDYFDAVHRHHYGEDAAPEVKARRVHDLFRGAECARLEPLLDFLNHHPKVRVVGPTTLARRAPTVSFVARGCASPELVQALAEHGVMCGHGHFYAARLIEALGLDLETGVVRVSFVHYTGGEDVQQLLEALERVLA
jgi:cysteine desulfurase family protein (TIGR01976 family)